MDEPPPAPSRSFSATRWSVVARAAGDDPAAREALSWLFRAYWEPLRAHAARRGWKDAEDAVQDFWIVLLERGAIASVDRARGRFRTWLLTCLDHHLADRADARDALKRGGGKVIAALPAEELFAQPGGGEDPAASFDLAWAETVLARARDRLLRGSGDQRAQQRAGRLAAFLTANGDAAAYAAAGAELGMSEGAVKVAVHRLRAAYRDCLRAEVADTLADPTVEAIDAELGDLLAALKR